MVVTTMSLIRLHNRMHGAVYMVRINQINQGMVLVFGRREKCIVLNTHTVGHQYKKH